MSFGAAFSRALSRTADQAGDSYRRNREQEQERQRQQALMDLTRQQMEAQQAAQAEARARQQALDQRDFAEGGYSAVDPLANRAGQAMDAVPLPDMGRLSGMTMTQGRAPQGRDVAFEYGGREFAKTGQSLREQEQQAARTERLTARSEDQRSREAERAADAARRAEEQAAMFANQEKMARLSASLAAANRPAPSPQLTQGNDGFMYRYDGGRMVRVPIDGMPSGGGDAGRSVEIPATGPRRDAVPAQAPGDTMFRGMGLQTAPRGASPAPSSSFGAPDARGPFGRAPGAGGQTDSQRRSLAVLNQMEAEGQVLDSQQSPGTFGLAAAGAPFGVGRGVMRKNDQVYMDAASSFAQHYIYGLSGQAAPDGEVARVVKSIVPQIGDSEEAKAAKAARRQQMIQTLRNAAGQAGASGGIEQEFPGQAEAIAQARQEGYTDAQIRSFLSGGRP
jgi:hypothetical protein